MISRGDKCEGSRFDEKNFVSRSIVKSSLIFPSKSIERIVTTRVFALKLAAFTL